MVYIQKAIVSFPLTYYSGHEGVYYLHNFCIDMHDASVLNHGTVILRHFVCYR